MGEQQDDVLRLEQERVGNRWKVAARWGASAVYIDTIDPAIATQRQRFIKKLVAKAPAVKADDLDAGRERPRPR